MWIQDNSLPVQNILGEGPLWHPKEHCLYWVDIHAGTINHFNPASGIYKTFEIGYPVGCLAFCTNGDLILAGQHGFSRWSIVTKQIAQISHPEPNRENARFNDGRVDSQGRFWAGTMTPEGMANNLYRLDPGGVVYTMETKIGISNGIGWSPDRQRMYFTDSAREVIYVYDYDELTGNISNRHELVSTREEEGVPDGLVIDREGCLWSARWDGWKVIRYSPQGEVIQEIPLPVKRPTSCTFGGSDLSTLFITSASIDLSSEQKEKQPLAGDLFWIETDTTGLEEHFYSG